MIDLHSHILPGLDDGAPDLESALALARAAVEAGTETMVATPHVREDYAVSPDTIAPRVDELNRSLEERSIGLTVVAGAEIGVTKLEELSDSALGILSLGSGPYLLIESPYTHASSMLENQLFELQVRGFRPILAHPERCPSFLGDRERLARFVARGVLCSVTAGSIAGRFGKTVWRFTVDLFRSQLVHNIASDAHDDHLRPPGLCAGTKQLDRQLPAALGQLSWYTVEAPRAILAGEELPGGPPRHSSGKRKAWPLLRTREP